MMSADEYNRERFSETSLKLYSIKVNGERVYLDGQALRAGSVKLDRATGSMSEQCDNCGGDILETASGASLETVSCQCGESFNVRTEETSEF